MSKTLNNQERELEGVAANIVHQIGDALYEALPKDIAHSHFVDARQATNDVAIDFAKKLINSYSEQRELEAIIKELSLIEINDIGPVYVWTVDKKTDTAMLISERIEQLKGQQKKG